MFTYSTARMGLARRTPGSISYIVPTIGRPSLTRAVASINLWPEDELLVIRGNEPGGGWGHEERNAGVAEAHGDWLAFLDDDDQFLPNARDDHARGIVEATAIGARVPIIFRMRFADSGLILWREGMPCLRCGNVGTPMMLVPNDPAKLGRWTIRQWNDFDFLEGSGWPRRTFIWRTEIVAEVDETPINPAARRRAADAQEPQ